MKYIADALVASSKGFLPAQWQDEDRYKSLRQVTSVRNWAKCLTGRELYAFDRSALSAASDIRMDTPSRMEGIISAVLARPRKIYMEASLSDLTHISKNMRGILAPERGSSKIPSCNRWGCFLDVIGGGRAEFRFLFGLTEKWWKGSGGQSLLDQELPIMPRGVRERVLGSMDTHIAPTAWDIDINRKVGLSKSELLQALNFAGPGNDGILCEAQKKMIAASGVRAKARVADAAWQAVRFRDLLRDKGLDNALDGVVPRIQIEAASIPTGAMAMSFAVPMIAMLALLEAESSDIRKEYRKKGKPRGVSRSARASPQKDALRVVSLNLSDRSLQRFYEQSGEASLPSDSGVVSGRLRHPVRGHLFLARNGKMTWRKPHWRGSIDSLAIRRVTAN